MYLLDTNIITALFKNDVKVTTAIASCNPAVVFVPSVCVFEVINGHNQKILIEQANFIKGKPNSLILAYRALCEALPKLAGFPVKHFDDAALDVYRDLPPKLRQNAKSNDSKIASIAVVNGLKLVTRNVKDFSEIRDAEGDLEILVW